VDNILGLVYAKDALRLLERRQPVVLRQILHPAHFVPESKKVGLLLRDLQKRRTHMAIVIDEHGSVTGLVTLEDLLEEIVGEIEDEFDLPDESVEKVDEHRIRIHGTFTIDDFNEQFHVSLPEEDYNTVGGFVFGELGHAPHEGDSVVHDGLHFTVFETDGNRIERLEVEFKPVVHRERSQEGPEADEAA